MSKKKDLTLKTPPPREVMSVSQVATYLGVSRDTIYKYVKNMKMPAFKLGNRWKFKLTVVDKWITTLHDLHTAK